MITSITMNSSSDCVLHIKPVVAYLMTSPGALGAIGDFAKVALSWVLWFLLQLLASRESPFFLVRTNHHHTFIPATHLRPRPHACPSPPTTRQWLTVQGVPRWLFHSGPFSSYPSSCPSSSASSVVVLLSRVAHRHLREWLMIFPFLILPLLISSATLCGYQNRLFSILLCFSSSPCG